MKPRAWRARTPTQKAIRAAFAYQAPLDHDTTLKKRPRKKGEINQELPEEMKPQEPEK